MSHADEQSSMDLGIFLLPLVAKIMRLPEHSPRTPLCLPPSLGREADSWDNNDSKYSHAMAPFALYLSENSSYEWRITPSFE